MPDFKVKVPFFDAAQLYSANKAELDGIVLKVLSDGAYINGPEVGRFANQLADYLNVNHVIPCGNGTDALCLALMALGLNQGDEVIVPTFNFIAAAEAVAFLGLTPVFADVSPEDFNITAKNIEEKISNKTKAIIVVHLFGAAADMEPILTLANQHQIFVIEDVAQALGSEYNGEKLGTFGAIGCTSFFPTKNLACFGDGGATFTRDQFLANKLKMLANHGQQKKYDHQYVGVNSRLDTLQAAILSHQLAQLDVNIEKRIALAQRYNEGLKSLDIGISVKREYTKHSFNQYCIVLKSSRQRDQLKAYLADQDIATMIYYSQPNHLQQAFSSLGYKVGDFPVAEDLCGTVLALPIAHLSITQQDDVIAHINAFFANA
ncbi:DegT/DnrJ/EryC1/StrS family aminotransferase [Pedobacter sp. SL55]|uniref:DegT/DnrJ/EryC1/StrS family aminotransferase n=1 Tax=Pedobacter sp. SL55 TaxID=2995161 RepID=UPI002270FF24|nr:DegT/DnrJ/EryC1/StrS family aminotransferase [Pedobacter sp. SL55]WAC41461.1 DegT/DnrJ/EryC1/StrS family aminotransferase [Pedobacter sp. SL55]